MSSTTGLKEKSIARRSQRSRRTVSGDADVTLERVTEEGRLDLLRKYPISFVKEVPPRHTLYAATLLATMEGGAFAVTRNTDAPLFVSVLWAPVDVHVRMLSGTTTTIPIYVGAAHLLSGALIGGDETTIVGGVGTAVTNVFFNASIE